jgi:hypothetical protein
MTPIEWLWEQIPFEFTSKMSAFEVLEQAKEMESEINKITEDTSDGYHTFKELYEFRKVYNAVLFNEWGKIYTGKFEHGIMDFKPKYDVHKSWKHNDGELCFGGGWFIVVAILPDGQISNHYEAKDWDLFQIPKVEKAKYPFDGHTPQDVVNRLKSIIK